jgi:hypothetical protein
MKIIFIAIDRAKKDAAEACKKFAKITGAEIEAYLLVSEDFKATSAYKGDEASGYFTEIVIDFNDTELLNDKIEDFRNNSDQIVMHCILESAMKDYSKCIELLPENSFVQSIESLIAASEKSIMRTKISEKYPEICPRFIILHNISDFSEDTVKDLEFPVIVKPNGLNSSFLVTKCEDYQELENCVKRTFSQIKGVYKREFGVGEASLIIEEFIVGDMYSIDSYINNSGECFHLPLIRVITAAELGIDGYYSYRHIVPVDLTPYDIERANECAKKAMLGIGLKNSSAHIELYKTENGWKLIELGARIGGYRQELYYEAFGIDHFYNDILIHSGYNPDCEPKWNKYAAGFNIYAESEGTITDIKGFEEASKVSSVVWLKKHANIGDNAVFNTNGGKYIIDGILSNDDPETLENDMKQIRNVIKIDVAKK